MLELEDKSKWPFGRLKKKIRKIFTKNKGSLKDPFLYLGIVLIVFFGIFFFGLGPILNSLSQDREFSLFKGLFGTLDKSADQNLFVGSFLKNSPQESANLILIQESSLRGLTPPVLVTPKVLGSLAGDIQSEQSSFREEIIEYQVQSDDSLETIATRFNISLNTLLWANNLSRGARVKPGQKLIILPVSGVIHQVKRGDTLEEIAREYKGDVDKIISFNDLSSDGDIFIGDILIIPDGVILPKPKKEIVKKPFSSNQIPIASSYFIVPVSSPYLITQGLHWYNAVDLGHPGGSCGKPVYAAAGGEVVKARYGDRLAGNNVSILHPNGVVTVYYHLENILVKPGQKVSAGEQIATIGKTGKASGCHLHFGVNGAKNPFVR